jgi:hypothetical protein
MKRTIGILATAVTLAVAPPAFAQGLGIKGGLSWNNVSNSGVLPGELQQHTGFAIGLGLGTTGTPFSVGIEGLYAQRGLNSSNPSEEVRFQYVDVPAYVRLAIPTEALALYAIAGPQISFEVGCEVGGVECSGDRETVGYAAVIGAGLRVGNQGALSFEGRYVYGLSDLSWSTVTDSDSYRTRSFMILAGLGF